MSKNNGGPAFPYQVSLQSGMTLRDYFAAKAMQAIISNDSMIQRLDRLPEYAGIPAAAAISKESYIIADAMLAEREREQ